MKNWQEFFHDNEDYRLTVGYYECERDFTLEDLYQAFKARMDDEASPFSGDRSLENED